jgi:hypothetical protein
MRTRAVWRREAEFSATGSWAWSWRGGRVCAWGEGEGPARAKKVSDVAGWVQIYSCFPRLRSPLCNTAHVALQGTVLSRSSFAFEKNKTPPLLTTAAHPLALALGNRSGLAVRMTGHDVEHREV